MAANQTPPPPTSRWFLYVVAGVVTILVLGVIIGLTTGGADDESTDTSAECPTPSEERYLKRMLEILDAWDAALEEVNVVTGELSTRPSLLHDRQWQSRMVPRLRAIRDLAAEIESVGPPASAQDVHDDLLIMSTHMRAFSEKYNAVLLGADVNKLNSEIIAHLEEAVRINNMSHLRIIAFCGS